jgi:AAHS family 4-hydroxybenzoate transporter-like MFS transporter
MQERAGLTPFSEAVSNAPLRAFQWVTVAVCLLVLVCDGIDMQLLGLVAPLIIEEWGIDRGDFGPAMSAALIGMAFGAWFGGWLGDTIGRRNSLALAALAFGLATVAASHADSVMVMAGLRVVGGLAFGAAFPNSLALASEWLPSRWRTYAITLLSVGTPAGGAAAAVLAEPLVEGYGWRGAFIAFGLATLVLPVLIFGLLRDSPSFQLAKGHKDRAQRAAAKVLIQDVDLGPEPEPAAAGSAEGNIGVFHRSNLRLNVGVGTGFAASTLIAYALLNWATSLLTAAGYSLEQAFNSSFLLGTASIAGAMLAGPLISLLGSRALLKAVGLCLLIAIVALAITLESIGAVPNEGHRGLTDVLLAAISGFASVGIATIYVIVTLEYPQSCRGAGIGFGMLMGRVGGILASYFGGTLLDLGEGSFVPFFAAMAVSAILVSTAAFVVDRHIPAARRTVLAV